jgi:transposase
MPALRIRKDRTPVMPGKLAKAEEDMRVARRLLAIANALDCKDRKAAAEAAGMDRQTLRDWVIRYNEHGLDGLLDRSGSGRPPRLEPGELAELYAIVMSGPDLETDGICAFTREDLVRIMGWTAGAGAEYALSASWSLKAEVLYARAVTMDFFRTGDQCRHGDQQRRSRWLYARLGVNYRF